MSELSRAEADVGQSVLIMPHQRHRAPSKAADGPTQINPLRTGLAGKG